MILAIGNSECLETEAYQLVRSAALERGSDILLFKQNKCLEGETLAFRVTDSIPAYFLTIDGREYSIEDFSAVWYMHPTLPKKLLAYEPAEWRTFISAQFLEMRRALWTLMRGKKWLNDPWRAAEAESKIAQLACAHGVGFAVPETLVTSHPDHVRQFYSDHGDLIVKTLGFSPILDYVIYTNRITDKEMASIDSVRMAPSIFQANIRKDYELRITVVGDRIFPVRIASQEDEQTAIDWRAKPKLNDFEVRMEPTVLPGDVERRLREFMAAMGLRYGCIDMIVTPAGEHVFLEVNPNGQWYFVQLKTGLKIAEAIADLLV
jgi:glutathione synthase/RimK-type ligase-like ATP-grasp enzyme